MLLEARERAVLLTDVHTELHLDLTSTADFGVEATISFGYTQPGASANTNGQLHLPVHKPPRWSHSNGEHLDLGVRRLASDEHPLRDGGRIGQAHS